MMGEEQGEAAIAYVLSAYPSLTSKEALTFLYVCAEDGLSLKALSKRLEEGQSTVARRVAALEQAGPDRAGLVVVSDAVEGQLRRTVGLSEAGRVLRDEIEGL